MSESFRVEGGKPWSVDEERYLRQLVGGGLGFNDISQAMGKSRVSVKCKLYNLGLSLKDNAHLQNQVASSLSSSSSKAPTVDSAPIIDPARVNGVALN